MTWTRRPGTPTMTPEVFAHSRGFLSKYHMKHPAMPDGSKIRNLKAAWQKIANAKAAGLHVVVYGDSDCDGICGTVIMTQALRHLEIAVTPFVSNRLKGGYGFGFGDVDRAKEVGADLVITVDCGIQDHEAIAEARRAGMDVMVVDNHIARYGPPDDVLCVEADPEAMEMTNLSAAGLAYMVAEGVGKVDPSWITLAALANIADVMPLRGEARAVVKYGLEAFHDSVMSPGLTALLASGDLLGQHVTPYQASFKLIPRLNAVGRMGQAELGIDLLMAETANEAARCLRGVEDCYKQRKVVTKEALPHAMQEAEALDRRGDRCLVVWGPWPKGILGILAAKLVDRFNKPSFVLTTETAEDDVMVGSARAPKGVDLYRLAEAMDRLLVRWGGHREAVGLSVSGGRKATALRGHLAKADYDIPEDETLYDAEVDLGIMPAIFADLESLGPFGHDVDPPTFVSRVDVSSYAIKLGAYGYKFTVSDSSCISFPAFLWNESKPVMAGDDPLILYQPQRCANGRIELNILDRQLS